MGKVSEFVAKLPRPMLFWIGFGLGFVAALTLAGNLAP